MLGPRLRRALSKLTFWQQFVLILFASIMFLTVFGPNIAPYDPIEASVQDRLEPPSAEHWFGTDDNGMDVFSRVLASPQIDVTIALVATAISVIIGSPLGVAIAMLEVGKTPFRRATSEVAMRLLEVIQSFPVFVFAMVLVAVFGGKTINIIAAVAFVNMPVFVRLVKSDVASLLGSPFVEAARAVGNNELSVGMRHILPNVIPTILVQVSVTIGFAILLTAGLSFVGAGVRPPAPELGNMIATGSKYLITGQWWPVIFPSIALGLTVFVFAIVGEIITKLMEPRAGRDVKRTDSDEAGNVMLESTQYEKERAPILAVSNLDVSLTKPGGGKILKDISFSIHRGEHVAIVGETGSGKSVLVKALLRLLPSEMSITSGSVEYDGRDLLSISRDELRSLRCTEISAVLPNAKSQLHPLFTVGEMMISAMQAHESVNSRQARQRAMEMLSTVGITDPARRLDAYPHELSGGMAQRVCLAIALMYKPRLIVADEPTAGLDVTIQRQVLDLIHNLTTDSNTAQIIITSDLGIAAHYCDRILVLKDGSIIESSTISEFFKDQKTKYSKMLLHSVTETV